ncbi:MAG: DUF998 domain-containing protein [Promethearchaeota archaeon]
MRDKSLNKIYELIPGGLFGLLSVVIGLIGDLLSILLYPGYNMAIHMASNLGIGPGGLIFNSGIVLSGIFAILFYLYMGQLFNDGFNEDKIVKTAVFFAVLSSIFFILVGIFPAMGEYEEIIAIHSVAALLSWLTGICYCCLFCYLILKTNHLSNFLFIFPFMALIAFSSLLIAIAIPNATIIVPLIEWTMVFIVSFFITTLASYTLYKRL